MTIALESVVSPVAPSSGLLITAENWENQCRRLYPRALFGHAAVLALDSGEARWIALWV